jgi:hypothetical protein
VGWHTAPGRPFGSGRPGAHVEDGTLRAARRSEATPIPLTPLAMPRDLSQQPAVRAPDFPAELDWINTGGRRLTLADFRGKVLLLDFWTYG